MNKNKTKNILVAAFFVALPLLCHATSWSGQGPDLQYLTPDGKNFLNVETYKEYVNSQGLPSVLIVGSGRGGFTVGLGKGRYYAGENYANDNYAKPWAYFLVDINPGFDPDMVYDVLDLGPFPLGENSWNRIIFECLPGPCALARCAIGGAIKLLKQGGELVIPYYFGTNRIELNNSASWNSIPFNQGGCFYYGNFLEDPRAVECRIVGIKSEFCGPSEFFGEEIKLSFFNEENQFFFKYMGEYGKDMGTVQFKSVPMGSDQWPKHCPIIAECITHQDVMIINKK